MYPASQQTQERIISSTQYSFAGGINTAIPQDRIAEDEARDIVNLRFNDQDSLIPRNDTISVLSQISAADITSQPTSVFSAYFDNSGSPVVKDILTLANGNVYTFTGGVATNIGSGQGNHYWQWKMYGDLAIGVNNATQAKQVNAAGTFAALNASAPTGKFIEVWADRVWIIGSSTGGVSDPNTLYGSALGNATDWTTTGAAGRVIIAIEPEDGDFITGIIAFRERLFIFKRTRIYVVQPLSGASSADATALSVDLYAQNIGCISGYSIQPVLDDVLFLSENGVASLVSSEKVGDFTSALLSRKLAGFRTLKLGQVTDYEVAACVVPEHSQYWLLVPTTLGLTEITYDSDSNTRENAYILDYRRIQEGIVRWSRYIGAAAGFVMCRRRQIVNSNPSFFIVGRIDGAATTYRVWTYTPTNSGGQGNDDYTSDRAVRYRLLTRSFDFNSPSFRKHFHRMFFDFLALQASGTTVAVTYYFDENTDLSATWNIPISQGPSVFGFGTNRQTFKANRKFQYNPDGARGSNVTFLLLLENLDDSFGIKSLSVDYSMLPNKRVNY